MVTLLLYSQLKRELQVIKKHSLEVICKISDDDWDVFEFEDKQKVMDFLKKNPILDMSCVDVAQTGGVEIAEQIRKSNGDMYIILVSDSEVSPMTYIKPTIMAGSLLLRPLSEENIKNVFLEAIREYLKKIGSDINSENKNVFVIDNRDGRQRIPYDRINFLEARSKKIYINTDNLEYSFYDTLDNLEKILNDSFVRCHRSFIVSKKSIKKIMFSQNLIELINGSMVPISRTYKSLLKELR